MIDFLITNLPVLVAALIVLVILVLFLIAFRRWRAATTNPQVQQIQAGLEPFIATCILGVEKTAQDFLKQFGKRLQTADKQKIADSWYALIPDTVWVNGKPLPVGEVKEFVTRDMFREWVKVTYDKMNAEVVKASDYLRKSVDYLIPDQYEPEKQWLKDQMRSLASGGEGNVG